MHKQNLALNNLQGWHAVKYNQDEAQLDQGIQIWPY